MEAGCDLHERWMVDRRREPTSSTGLCSAVGDLVHGEAGSAQHRLGALDEPVPVDKLEDPGAGDLQADLAFVSVTVASAGLAAAKVGNGTPVAAGLLSTMKSLPVGVSTRASSRAIALSSSRVGTLMNTKQHTIASSASSGTWPLSMVWNRAAGCGVCARARVIMSVLTCSLRRPVLRLRRRGGVVRLFRCRTHNPARSPSAASSLEVIDERGISQSVFDIVVRGIPNPAQTAGVVHDVVTAAPPSHARFRCWAIGSRPAPGGGDGGRRIVIDGLDGRSVLEWRLQNRRRYASTHASGKIQQVASARPGSSSARIDFSRARTWCTWSRLAPEGSRGRAWGSSTIVAIIAAEEGVTSGQVFFVDVDRADVVDVHTRGQAQHRGEKFLDEREGERVVEQSHVRVVGAHERDHVQTVLTAQQLESQRAGDVDVAAVDVFGSRRRSAERHACSQGHPRGGCSRFVRSQSRRRRV